MKIMPRFLLGFFLALMFFAAVNADEWDQFELVKDKRNYKESVGGKGVPPQGRILDGSEQFLYINKGKLKTPPKSTDKEWRYVVTLNCKKGGRAPEEIIEAVATKLCAPSERHRLAFILGINERASITSYGSSLPAWQSMGINASSLEAKGIPVLVVYFQWTSFWEKRDSPHLTASQVQAEMTAKVASLAARQRPTALTRIGELETHHQYPFGQARTFLLQNHQTESFVTTFSHGQDVYMHIQDSDFINLQEDLMFGDFGGNHPLIPANDNYLLARYDALIGHHRDHHKHGSVPVTLGGAHVYSPMEDLDATYLKTLSPKKQREKLNSEQAKHATRFGSEMGNNLKHLMGIHQPYGLYFHEPNTLILSPVSAKRRLTQAKGEFKIVYERLSKGFRFGIDSEVQDFTRMLFKDLSDDTCGMGMIFSSTTVLSTSMKRNKKPFAIRYGGKFDRKTRSFQWGGKSDLKAFRGMSQEIIHPNKWGSNLATSYLKHKVHDARKLLYQLFSYFDPLEALDLQSPESYSSTLIDYDEHLQKKKMEIRALFHTLKAKYDAQKQGSRVALEMLSIAWESGQMMRLMLLDHFVPLADVQLEAVQDQTKDIRAFLALRFNFAMKRDSSAPVENPFIKEFLEETPVPKISPAKLLKITRPQNPDTDIAPQLIEELSLTSHHVAKVISWFLKRENHVKARVMRTLNVKTPRTLEKLMANEAPRSWQQIVEKVNTPAHIAQNFPDLSNSERDELLKILKDH